MTKRIEIEKSHYYIGYKLLWVINLLIEGVKFNTHGQYTFSEK